MGSGVVRIDIFSFMVGCLKMRAEYQGLESAPELYADFKYGTIFSPAVTVSYGTFLCSVQLQWATHDDGIGEKWTNCSFVRSVQWLHALSWWHLPPHWLVTVISEIFSFFFCLWTFCCTCFLHILAFRFLWLISGVVRLWGGGRAPSYCWTMVQQ